MKPEQTRDGYPSNPQIFHLPRTLTRFLYLRAQSSGGVGDGDAVIIVDQGFCRKESNLLLSKLNPAVTVSYFVCYVLPLLFC